jgi:hypothetical protein
VRIFRRRARLRPLDEQECYARLHGARTGKIAVVQAAPPGAEPDGPTEESPALHLLIAYPRNAGRLTGEQVRLELLRRIQARQGEAA